MDEGDDDEGDYSEEEMVTELALRDWSERSGRGRSIEDLALPRIDAGSVEAQRDRALREFTERQARMERESEAARIQRQAMGLTPPSRAGTVNLTAARPMGMLNLSAKAAGMRGQGSATSSPTEEPTAEVSRKPATAKAKTKKSPKVAATARPEAGGSGARTAKKVPRKATNDTLKGPAAKSTGRATKATPGPAKTTSRAAKAAPRAPQAAPGPANSTAVAPRAPGKAAKIAGKTDAGKTDAGKAAKTTAKPVAKPGAKVAKAVAKAPKAAGKAVGKAAKASRGREGGEGPQGRTGAGPGPGRKVSAAKVTPAKKKKAAAAAPAKVSPTPRKGSGRR